MLAVPVAGYMACSDRCMLDIDLLLICASMSCISFCFERHNTSSKQM